MIAGLDEMLACAEFLRINFEPRTAVDVLSFIKALEEELPVHMRITNPERCPLADGLSPSAAFVEDGLDDRVKLFFVADEGWFPISGDESDGDLWRGFFGVEEGAHYRKK